jgi:hypothetical protein
MVRLRAKADSPDASEQRFLCPESSTPKAIRSYLFLHTSYRAYLDYARLFDLYLSREASAMLPTNWQKNATLGKKARSGF